MNDIVLSYQDKAAVSTYDEVERAANAMAKSGFFSDTKSAAQAVVKILAAREIGLGPFAGMTGVNIIQGKPAFGANIMAACVKKSGRYNYKVVEMTEKACTIEFSEKLDGKWIACGTSSFTIEDARKAGTKNLEKFPRNMLFARAMSNGVRWFCPDVMNGSTVYTPEELGAETDIDGNVVEAESTEAEFVREQEVEPEAEEAPVKAEPLTLEAAMKIESKSAGKIYGELAMGELTARYNALVKALKSNDLTPVEYAEKERKLAALKLIINAKNKGEID
ncbi:MAG TPA: hypothetical protein PK953_12350 [Smithellaceae bacterium]|jgi:hypothetical protein|nr:hypothetical protein [Smithellaceae bacterium]